MTLHDITSVEELHNYLLTAVQLGHATIPPYLTTPSSIHPNTHGPQLASARVKNRGRPDEPGGRTRSRAPAGS